VLAQLGKSVVGLEPEPELVAFGRRLLAERGLANAEIVEGPLAQGHPAKAPYDVIFLNGSLPAAPEDLLAQLKEGGRLVAMIASSARPATQARAYLFVRVAGEASGLSHFDAGAPPLPGFAPSPVFSF
jgi:protein-L-isoaspartate(D-aspartate) O-methyltransferase